jgi:hypothetical protein
MILLWKQPNAQESDIVTVTRDVLKSHALVDLDANVAVDRCVVVF